MSLSDYASKYTGDQKVVSAIEFIQSPAGFNTKLLPAQRFLIKLLDHKGLDDTLCDIKVMDRFNEKVLHKFTEMGFYGFLRAEGKISLDYDDYLDNPMIQNLLAIGRRGAKTSTISLWIGAKLYHLLSLDHPQVYFGILPEDPITVTITALGEDNAEKLFSRLSNLLSSCRFFKKHMPQPVGVQSVKLWTNHDLKTRKGPNSNSITVSAWANSPSVRGENNIFAVMEEIAHFNVKQSTKESPLDKMIYDSLTPSVSSFSEPNGNPFGKTFLISTPLGKQGLFYEIYEKAFEIGPDTGCLAINAPTWYFNNEIKPVYLRAEYVKNPSGYDQEYGAEFSSQKGGLLKQEYLYRCFVRSNRNYSLPKANDDCYVMSLNPTSRYRHFAGGDFALSNDGTAFGISHFEPKYYENPNQFHSKALSLNTWLAEKVVENCGLDNHINPWFEKSFVSGGMDYDVDDWIIDDGVYVVDYLVGYYAGKSPFETDEVLEGSVLLDELRSLFRHWPIVAGIFDQWSGELIEQMMKDKQLTRMKMAKFTPHDNEIVYTTFMNLYREGRIKFAYDPKLESELLGLVSIKTPKGFRVEARSGFHDDRFDALSRSVFLCYADRMKYKKFAGLNLKELFAKGSSAFIRKRDKNMHSNFNPVKSSRDNRKPRERDLVAMCKSMGRMAGMR